MQEIPLLSIANQSLNVVLDPGEFTITLREGNGVMLADIVLEGVTLVSGVRCLAQEPVIPYYYLQNGNFVFQTVDNALPYWDQFGTTQSLFFLTDDEMAGNVSN